MTSSVTITVDADGKPLEVLNDLIGKRVSFLKGETTENAVRATAINVVTSIRAATKVAKLKPDPESYTVTLVRANAAGWRNRRRTPIGQDGHRIGGIRPVNLMYGLKGQGDLYKITLTNPALTPRRGTNAPFYYVLSPNASVAAKFAAERVARALRKERGLAKLALGYAQARISDRPMSDQASGRKGAVASEAAVISVSGAGFSSGSFAMEVSDKLRYSKLALNGGDAALSAAMEKAANRTAAIINRLGGIPLDEQIPTPFPEVSKK